MVLTKEKCTILESFKNHLRLKSLRFYCIVFSYLTSITDYLIKKVKSKNVPNSLSFFFVRDWAWEEYKGTSGDIHVLWKEFDAICAIADVHRGDHHMDVTDGKSIITEKLRSNPAVVEKIKGK